MNDELITATSMYGTPETGLTIEYAWNAGKAVADWLPTAGSVVVAYSATQRTIANALIEGLRLQGRHVIDGGIGDGDAVTAHIRTSGLSGGASVTADAQNNISIEVYKDDAQLVGRDTGLLEISELVEAGNFVPAAVKGELTAIA